MTDKKYDYIIIGAGGSGAVIARQLLQKCNVSVLVLEQGKNHGNDPNVNDAKKWYLADSLAQTTQTYTTIREAGAKNRRYNIVRGRGWGGTTASTWLFALRPSQKYLENFSKVSGVPLVILNSFYKDLERYIPQPGSVADPSRGKDGRMVVTQLPLGATYVNLQREDVINYANNLTPGSGGLADLIAQAFNVPALEIPNDDFNAVSAPEVLAATRQQVFASDLGTSWLRSYTGTAFLGTDFVLPNGQGVGDYNIRIIDRTRVTKINFKPVKTKCEIKGCNCTQLIRPKSVDAWVDNVCCTFHARCGVILAAGFVETPALLQRSGIGPAALLDKLCIKKCIANEHVGHHLLNQVCSNLNYSLCGSAAGLEALNSQVALIHNCILSSDLPECIYPECYDPCRVMGIFASLPQKDRCHWDAMFTICSFLPRDQGSIEIVAQDAFSQYNINVPLFSKPEELAAFRHVFRTLAEQIKQFVINYNNEHPEDLVPLALSWPCGDPSELCDAELNELIIDNVSIEAGSSTARMGIRGSAVVDQKFQVYGTCGLYVADNSVYPLLFDGHDTYTAMAIGWQFAEQLSLKCPKRKCGKPIEDLYSNCRVVKNCCDDKKKHCIIENIPCHPDPCAGICDSSASECSPKVCHKKKCGKKEVSKCSKKAKARKDCCKYECESRGEKCRYYKDSHSSQSSHSEHSSDNF